MLTAGVLGSLALPIMFWDPGLLGKLAVLKTSSPNYSFCYTPCWWPWQREKESSGRSHVQVKCFIWEMAYMTCTHIYQAEVFTWTPPRKYIPIMSLEEEAPGNIWWRPQITKRFSFSPSCLWYPTSTIFHLAAWTSKCQHTHRLCGGSGRISRDWGLWRRDSPLCLIGFCLCVCNILYNIKWVKGDYFLLELS